MLSLRRPSGGRRGCSRPRLRSGAFAPDFPSGPPSSSSLPPAAAAFGFPRAHRGCSQPRRPARGAASFDGCGVAGAVVGGEVCIARRNWPRGRPVSAYVVSCVGFRRCALIQSSENWRLLGLRRTANLRDEPGKAAKLVALESSYVIMIFTIGYEGIDLTRFMSLLSHHDIETVVDVREMPLSRKRGFQNRVENGAPSIRLRIRSPGDAGLSQGHQKSV